MRSTLKHPLSLALVSVLLATVAGCGGSDDNNNNQAVTPPPPAPPPVTPPAPAKTTLTGSAMRNAALQNAVVCMDLNANSACDAGEPAAADPTDANGAWSLTYDTTQASADQVAAASLIALVTPATTDAGRSGQSATTQPYVLRQVPGKSGQINPLTTLVAKGMKDGMTEAMARSNAAQQLGIAEAKIDNYQDDPAVGPELVRDNARAVAAFTGDALENGAVLLVVDQTVSLDAQADILNVLAYFDAANYFVATTGLPAKAAGSTELNFTSQNSQRMAGTPVTDVRALYPSIFLTPGGWQRCDASTLHTVTLGNPNRSTFCGAQEAIAYRTPPVDIGGKPMAEVINQLQADPASNSINKTLTPAGLLTAVGTATFPAGAQLQKTTSLILQQPLFVTDTRTQAIPQAQATTLEQLVAARPASNVNLATTAGSLSVGLGTSALRNLRVAFTGTTSATEGTVQYYDCDLSVTDMASNCTATNTGTYRIGTVNGVRVMRFEGLPPAPASFQDNFYAEVDGGATGNYIYRVRQNKSTLASTRSVSNRLDSTAWAALKAKLGL